MDIVKALGMLNEPRFMRSSFRSDFFTSDVDAYESVFTRRDRVPQYTLNGDPVDIIDLCRTNGFDAETVREIRALGVGERVHFGGQGCMTLRRVLGNR